MVKKVLFLMFFALPLQAEEPWSVNPVSPTIVKADEKPLHQHKKSSGGLAFYQKYISSFDGPRCSLSPTCSGYAAQSFERFGFFMGLVLTADRLMHEGDKVDWLKVIPLDPRYEGWQIGATIYDWVWASRLFGRRPYFADSVYSNSYWWNH
jgi:hypothetical protein